jgi:hypothetical protein
MAENKRAAVEQVPCEICLREVPKDEAKVAEAADYVMYFCGIDCYAKWQKKEKDAGEDGDRGC